MGADRIPSLPRSFYSRDTVTVARELLGCYLVRQWQDNLLIGKITETEAYVGATDKACHAYGYRRTGRTEILFGQPGHSYIYFVYGMHHCLNVVTEPEGEPAAVLIRAMTPIHGIAEMIRLRYPKAEGRLTAAQKKNFSNGPGKLCKALGLTLAENGLDLLHSSLVIAREIPALNLPPAPPTQWNVGKRIGIDYAEEAVDFPWRFWIEEKSDVFL